MDLYTYNATVINIVDGDTLDVTVKVDIGFHFIVNYTLRVRLLGIDTPEIFKPKSAYEKTIGTLIAKWTDKELLGKEVIIKTYKDKTEKYGRYLAEIFLDGVNINEIMLANGFDKSRALTDVSVIDYLEQNL